MSPEATPVSSNLVTGPAKLISIQAMVAGVAQHLQEVFGPSCAGAFRGIDQGTTSSGDIQPRRDRRIYQPGVGRNNRYVPVIPTGIDGSPREGGDE